MKKLIGWTVSIVALLLIVANDVGGRFDAPAYEGPHSDHFDGDRFQPEQLPHKTHLGVHSPNLTVNPMGWYPKVGKWPNQV